MVSLKRGDRALSSDDLAEDHRVVSNEKRAVVWETRGPCADFRRWEVDARIYGFLIGGYTDFLSLGSEESGGRVYFTI